MLEEQELPESRVLQISDPCCGAGGMLVAGASVLKDRGFNYQQNALFFAQDIDARCARMTFIQLSLLAAPAVIICGNTLTNDVYRRRETIGYHLSGMDYRLKTEKIIDLMKELEIRKPEVSETPPVMKKTETAAPAAAQGELF